MTLVVDKNMGIFEAAEKSAEMMKGNYWNVLGYGITLGFACLGIILLGLICLILGVIPAAFIAFWIMTFADLWLYKHLQV